MPHPPALAHDPIEEIATDVFMVRGRIQMNAWLRITRNMAILRHGRELTLVNTVRLDDAGLRDLRALGDVKRIFRLGPMHGTDDPYYIESFGPELWTPGESSAYPEPKPDRVLSADVELPLPDADVFCFEGMRQPEVALRLRTGGGLLLTCDSLQHYGDYRHNNLLARIVMPFTGFPRRMVVGPIWLRMMTPEGGSLEGEFRRLLELDFDAFLSAHGSLLRTGAHHAVKAAVDAAFA